MSPKPRLILQSKDDLAWEKSDGANIHNKIIYQAIADFILKLSYEVATMHYMAAHTTNPVPHIYHYESATENPTGLGPFIIMKYINHDQTLSHALNDRSRRIDEYHKLDSNISDDKLGFIYRQMARIVLQLSTLKVPRIDSLVEDKEGVISVEGRLLIQMAYSGSGPRTSALLRSWIRSSPMWHRRSLPLIHLGGFPWESQTGGKTDTRCGCRHTSRGYRPSSAS